MNDMRDLDRLAQMAGIEPGWWDFFGNWRQVPDETKRHFLKSMGLPAANDAEASASLQRLEERTWRRGAPATHIVRLGQDAPPIPIALHEHAGRGRWRVLEESGNLLTGEFNAAELEQIEERWIDGKPYFKRLLPCPAPLGIGYHRLSVELGPGLATETSLIVAPPSAYIPEPLHSGGRVWGVSAQLYGLRRGQDKGFGIGDFTALRDMVEAAGDLGAGAVGLNPLHARFMSQPDRISPYSPSSRLFLDAIYIDPQALPEFAQVKALADKMEGQRQKAEMSDLIDYPEVAAMKFPLLEEMFGHFRKNELGKQPSERGRDFLAYVREQGASLERFARFQALQEHFQKQASEMGWWRRWPEGFRSPNSPDVAHFAMEHEQRIQFFQYLEYLADRQLGAAEAAARKHCMAIGLYRDLGVGIPGDSGEAWSLQDALALGIGVGAPPDPLNLKGQDWGLSPFNPVALDELGYAPFAQVLRANMRHAGAMRLDHAMSLVRLYWVPEGNDADQGAYVRMPADALFAVLALESQRAKCLVIGEDLGTVPDGFRERMKAEGLFAYRLLPFERRHDGQFKRPHEIDAQALVTAGTHDLAPLAGWWKGRDLDWREQLRLYPKPETAGHERHGRHEDRQRLVWALSELGCIDPIFPADGHLDLELAGQLCLGVHRYLCESPTQVMMAQFEDMLLQEEPMNLPGTVAEHPNWRRRYARSIEDWRQDGLAKSIALHLSQSRPSLVKGQTAP
ncbi:4-alpha-glucanotransferase [Rhodospirillaceae bacterium LM-1]|nr:4-alpha-glucanotransferase [Rhodospirillaceae bacterium LM-1]